MDSSFFSEAGGRQSVAREGRALPCLHGLGVDDSCMMSGYLVKLDVEHC